MVLHIVRIFFLWWGLFKNYSFSNFEICKSIVNYSLHALHYIPRIYLSYNWRLVSFDHLQNISGTLQYHYNIADTTISSVGEDVESWGLLDTVSGGVSGNFGRQFGMMSYAYSVTSNCTSRNVCLRTARHTYKNSPSSVVCKVYQQLNEKINCGVIVGKSTRKQWNWENSSSLHYMSVKTECWAKESRHERRQTIFYVPIAQKQRAWTVVFREMCLCRKITF